MSERTVQYEHHYDFGFRVHSGFPAGQFSRPRPGEELVIGPPNMGALITVKGYIVCYNSSRDQKKQLFRRLC